MKYWEKEKNIIVITGIFVICIGLFLAFMMFNKHQDLSSILEKKVLVQGDYESKDHCSKSILERKGFKKENFSRTKLEAIGLCLIVTICIYNILSKAKYNYTIKRLAYKDNLTGIGNLNQFKKDATKILKKDNINKYVVIYGDIEKFKYINDKFGYEIGDQILIHVAQVLKRQLPRHAVFARVSGDHFVVLVRYTTERLFKEQIIKIYSEFQNFNTTKNAHYKLIFSAGVYEITEDDTNITTMIDKAHMALSTIKGGYKNRYVFYNDEIREKVLNEKEIENKMESALENNEFIIYLQPQYQLNDKKLVGAEALVRWKNPEKGLIPPNDFIPLFEKNNFVLKLDLYVFKEVCKKLREWIDSNKQTITIAVNLSQLHFKNINIVNSLKLLVEHYNIPPHLIELEITESAFIKNSTQFLFIVKQLKNLGFHISMDDFGTGYSSLNLLKKLPVDILKLDKEFFTTGQDIEREKIIIESIVRMARHLNMKVIAEGVEYNDQEAFLKKIGCDMVQGYLFAKPMPIEDFEEYLQYQNQS